MRSFTGSYALPVPADRHTAVRIAEWHSLAQGGQFQIVVNSSGRRNTC